MNKSIKIALLVVAFIVVVGAVIYFADTVLGPPSKPTKVNQYTEAIDADIAALDKANPSQRYTDFIRIADLIAFQKKNGLLDAAQNDKEVKALVAAYVPKFVEESNNVFKGHSWGSSEMALIKSRAAGVQGLKLSDGNSPLGKDEQKQLAEITNVISNYDAAWSVANSTNYSNAQSLIASANRYRSMSPINNCSTLVSALNGLPAKLGNAHYSSISSAVSSFASRYANSTDTDAVEYAGNNLKAQIAAYENATGIYGTSHSTSDLINTIDRVIARVWENTEY